MRVADAGGRSHCGPVMPNHLLLAVSFAVLGLILLAPGGAIAQSDVVRTSDGSFVRGTIVERVEGSHVTVQTVGGELRRFDLREVTYAGPDQMQVQAQTPMQAPTPGAPAAQGHELTITQSHPRAHSPTPEWIRRRYRVGLPRWGLRTHSLLRRGLRRAVHRASADRDPRHGRLVWRGRCRGRRQRAH